MAKKMYKSVTTEMIAVYHYYTAYGTPYRYIEAVFKSVSEARAYVDGKKLSGAYSSSDFMIEPVTVRMKAWDGIQRNENLI